VVQVGFIDHECNTAGLVDASKIRQLQVRRPVLAGLGFDGVELAIHTGQNVRGAVVGKRPTNVVHSVGASRLEHGMDLGLDFRLGGGSHGYFPDTSRSFIM
jgi:hypothetical protein